MASPCISPTQHSSAAADIHALKTQPRLMSALDGGTDLRQLDTDLATDEARLTAASITSLADSAPAAAALWQDLTAAEDALAAVVDTLTGFQTSLATASSSIRDLQAQSIQLRASAVNRRAAAEELAAYLDTVSVPESMVTAIVEGPVDHQFAAAVSDLAKKLQAHAAAAEAPAVPGKPRPHETAAGRDAAPLLAAAKAAAISRGRDALLRHFAELRKGKTHVAHHQTYVLGPLSPLWPFFEQHDPSVALELRIAYTEAAGRTFGATFRSYGAALNKLAVSPVTKNDTLVPTAPLSTMRRLFSSAPQAASAQRAAAFSLGSRARVLTDAANVPLLPALTGSAAERQPLEVRFYALQTHLLACAQDEMDFCMRFLGPERGPGIASAVLRHAVSAVLAWLQEQCSASGDVTALLLCIAVVASAHHGVHDRPVAAALDGYFDRASMLLWPAVKQVLGQHTDSLRQAATEPAKYGVSFMLAPHWLTTRAAELVASVLACRSLIASSLHDELSMDAGLDMNLYVSAWRVLHKLGCTRSVVHQATLGHIA